MKKVFILLLLFLCGCSTRPQTMNIGHDLFQNLYVARGCLGVSQVRPSIISSPPIYIPLMPQIEYINKEHQNWPHPDQARLWQCIKLGIPYDGVSGLTAYRYIVLR